MESCPDCGTHLTGGWVQRTREVIELPVVPVQVTEHVFIARTCPACRRRCIPPAQLDGVALGRQRLGVNLISRIATLREEGRLPIRSIQWYLPHRPSAAPQRGGHRERHSPDRATGPTSGGRDPGPHPRQPSGPRRRNRLAPEWEQRLRLDFQHPHRTLLPAAGSGQGGGGRGAERVILRSTGQRFLRRLPPLRWPQATVLGPPVAGYPRPGGALPQGHRAGPVGRGSPSTLCRGQVFHPSSGTTTAHRSTGLGAAAAGHRPALPG